MSKEVSKEKSNEEIKKDILKLILSTGELKTASDVSKMFSELQGQISRSFGC